MGATGSKKKSRRLVFLGLDGSGKSVLIRRLVNIHDYANVSPNNSILIYNMKYKGVPLNIWDNPGDIKFRNLSCHQLKDPSAVCYVVDSSDESRYSESQTELNKLDENLALKNVPFLIIAAKSDLTPQLSLDDFKEKFPTKHSPSLTDYVFISTIKDSSMIPVLEILYGLIMGIRKTRSKQEKTRPTSHISKSPDKEVISSPTKSVEESTSKIKTGGHDIILTDITEENANSEDIEKNKISDKENSETGKTENVEDSEDGETEMVDKPEDRKDPEIGEEEMVDKPEDKKDTETGEEEMVDKPEDKKDTEIGEEDKKDPETGETEKVEITDEEKPETVETEKTVSSEGGVDKKPSTN